MEYTTYKKVIRELSEHLKNKGFLKNGRSTFKNENVIFIFHYSSFTFKTRMYVLDSNTKKHLETYLYDYIAYTFCIKEIKNRIQKIGIRYEKLHF